MTHAQSGYTVRCRQLFNVFGAPGIPNVYDVILRDRDGDVVRVERVNFEWRAERKAAKWARMYGAQLIP